MDKKYPFFSIVIPVYNSYGTIKECLDSVLSQTFQSFEVILVDDGSTDGSSEICDEYVATNDNFIVIHKQNSGPYKSRVMGIEKASGKYITGLDSDDRYVDDYLETIHNHLKEENYDIAIWSCAQMDSAGNISKIPDELIGEQSGYDILLWVLESTSHSFVLKAFKSEILKKIDYSGVPDIILSDDYCHTVPFLFYVKKAVVLDYYGYLYRYRKDSISHTIDYSKIVDLCRVSEYGIQLLKDHDFFNSKTVLNEHIGFMRVFIDRMIYALQHDMLTKEQIDSILNSKAYVEAEDAEREDIFGEEIYHKMKLIRERKFDDLIKG